MSESLKKLSPFILLIILGNIFPYCSFIKQALLTQHSKAQCPDYYTLLSDVQFTCATSDVVDQNHPNFPSSGKAIKIITCFLLISFFSSHIIRNFFTKLWCHLQDYWFGGLFNYNTNGPSFSCYIVLIVSFIVLLTNEIRITKPSLPSPGPHKLLELSFDPSGMYFVFAAQDPSAPTTTPIQFLIAPVNKI